MAEVTLTISADDDASAVLTKVSQGLDVLTKRSEETSQASQKAGQAAKEGGKGFGQFASSLDDTAAKLKDLLTPTNLLGAGIGVGLVAALKSAQDATIAYADELTRLKGVTGSSIEELAGLRESADKMGVGSDKLQRALLLMSSQIDSGGEALGRMGISIEDVNGKQKAELTLLFEVIDKLSGMSNKIEAAALAKKTFGRAVGDLLPLLLAGTAAIKASGEAGAAFAKELGDEGVASIRKFKGQVAESEDAIDRLKITILRDAQPVLSFLVTSFTAVVEAARSIPPDIRHIIEVVTVVGAGLLSLALIIKTAVVAWTLLMSIPAIAWLVNAAVAMGSLVVTSGALVPVLITLGGALAAAFILDFGGITSRFVSFLSDLGSKIKNFASSVADSFKLRGLTAPETPGLSTADDARELRTARARQELAAESQAELERNLALSKKRLEVDKEILSEKLKFFQATQAPDQAQISTIKENLALKLRELEIKREERKDLIRKFDEEESEAKLAAAAQTLAIQIASLKTIDAARAESLKAQITASETGEARIRDLAKAETDAVTQQLTDQAKSRTLSTAEIVQAHEKNKQIMIKANDDIRKLAIEQAMQLSAIAQKEAETVLKAHENEIEHSIAGLELEQVARQHAFDTFKISLTQFTAESIANTEAVKQEKLTSLKAQEDAAIANAARELALAEAKWTGIKGGEVELAIKTKDIATDLQKRLEEITGQRVKTEDEADKHALELRLQEAKQAGILFAQEAGQIEDLKRKREQSLQNIGTFLENQARQAGDLGAAFQVGFAQAASSADDALAAMKKAGADTFASLKSGLSDFLFDIFTGAKNIGDVFVNLGKRILRSFTDVFAEILAKQLAMAAGFSLPGLLSTARTAVAATAGFEGAPNQAATAVIAATAGFEGAPNQAAQAVTQLGTSATTASQALGGVGQVSALLSAAFGSLGTLLLTFGSVVLGVVKLLASIGSFGAVGSIGSAAGGVLGSITSLGSAFGNFASLVQGGLANTIQGVFNAFGAGPGGFFGAAAFEGAPNAIATAIPGLGASLLAKAIPIAGGLISIGLDFLHGNIAGGVGGTIGGGIGAYFGGPVGFGIGAAIGSFLGGIFGGLFGSTPKSKLVAQVAPFDLNQLLTQPAPISTEERTLLPFPSPQHHGSFAGPVFVNVGGNIFDSDAQKFEIERKVATALASVLQQTLQAFSRLGTTLPTVINAQLDTAMKAVAEHGLGTVFSQIIEDEEGTRLQEGIKALPGHLVQSVVDALGIHIDLAALGAGDAAKGFDALLAAMKGLSAITQMVSKDFNFSAVTLDHFATSSVKLFQQFAKEGETFTDTIKRVADGFGQLFQFIDQLSTDIASATGDVAAGMQLIVDAYQQSVRQIKSTADALTVAVESGAGPEEVTAAAKAARDATSASIAILHQAEAGLQSLAKAIANGVDLYADLEGRIRSLGGETTSVKELLSTMTSLISTTQSVSAQIHLYGSTIKLVAGNFESLTAALPALTSAFHSIFGQIHATTNNAQAIDELKALSAAITEGGAAARQGIAAAAERERAAAQQASSARLSALQVERNAIQNISHEQQQVIQTQINSLHEWQRIADSVKSQLVDLFNFLAPTHPQTSFNTVLAQFRSAVSGFSSSSTPEAATAIQNLAKQTLQLAQGVPGMDLPSLAFQNLAAEVQAALETVQAIATNRPSEQDLLNQISVLNESQAESLRNIDAKIQAEQQGLQQTLQAISAQEQAQMSQISQIESAALQAIRGELRDRLLALQTEQEAARQVLMQITAGLSFEQFIAQKQAESVDMLVQIRNVLRGYLGNILAGLGFGVPQFATGTSYVQQTGLALIHQGEEIIPANRQGSSRSSSVVINLSPTIHLTTNGPESQEEISRKLDRAIASIISGPSLTRRQLSKLAKEAAR